MQSRPRGVSFRISISLFIVVGLLCARPASAAITITGSIDPNYNSTDPWNVGGDLTVGAGANGTLDITDGSQVLSNKSTIAASSGTTASVVVTGADSAWQTSDLLSIGDGGSGSLSISAGASVTSSAGALAGYTSSMAHGSIVVTGPGSIWHVSEGEYGLRIGGSGSATLSIAAGGRVDANYVRVTSGTSDISRLTVSGPDSLLQSAQYLSIRSGARMDVNDGGQVTSHGGDINGIVHVDGAGSAWMNSSSLMMGGDADLTISNGGHVSDSGCVIQPSNGQTVNVTVTGEDSLWENQSGLLMGYKGDVSLLISDGGNVTSDGAYVKAWDGGTASVTVAGSNSVWTNTGTLTVGDFFYESNATVYHPDQYGTITVSDGGTVETDDLIVWAGSVLAGNGTFKARQITNHGIIEPGNSIGTLTIDGDIALEFGSILETEIDNSGNSDKLVVTGGVDVVDGRVNVVSTEAITASQEYTIVEANSVSGQFAALDTSELDTGATIPIVELSYEPNAILLAVTPTAYDDAAFSSTGNEKQVGSALQQIADRGGNAVTAAVGDLHTAADVRSAYDQLSGQTRAPLGFVTTEGEDRHLGIISNRVHSAAGTFSKGTGLSDMLASANPAGPGFGLVNPGGLADDMGVATGSYLFALGNGTPYLGDQPWGVWGRGYGLGGDRETREGISGYQYSTYGTCFGLDYRFSEQWLFGLTTGFSRGDIDHARSSDTTDIDATHFGFYGSYEQPGGYIDFIADYADLDFETRRYVDVVDERLDGDFGGSVAAGYLEGGLKRWLSTFWMLQPLASFQIVYVDIDRFSESGGDSRLTFDDQQFESYKGSLGTKVIGVLRENPDDGTATAVEFRGRWLHEFGDIRSKVRANFVSDPGLPFIVTDAAAPRDSALLGVGLDTWFSRAFRGFVDYDTELSRDNVLHVVSVGLQYRW